MIYEKITINNSWEIIHDVIIVKVIKKETQHNGEYIDNLYLEQVAIQNKFNAIEASNKLYSEIAFFLQILSLVLIILRKDFPEL